MPDLILDYAIVTDPDPLAINGVGQVKLLVSNPNPHLQITIQDIKVSFLGGPGGRDLTSQSGTKSVRPVAPNGWGHSYDTSGEATFTPTSDRARHLQSAGALLVFENVGVNGEIGNAAITITERICVGDAAPQTAKLETTVPKIPAGYQFGDFYADPSNVDFGGSVTLHWKGGTGASYVIKYDDTVVTHVQGDPDTPLPAEGSLTIGPIHEDTPFELEVSFGGDKNGPKLHRYAPVKVLKATIDHFIGLPVEVKSGQSTRLTWITNADSCSISPGIGKVDAPSGSIRVKVDSTTDFTLTATKGSDIAQQSRPITVPKQLINRFDTDTPLPINLGDFATLNIDVVDATKIEIEGDGSIDPIPLAYSYSTYSVYPKTDTKYTLRAYGGGPVQEQHVNVTVADPAIISVGMNVLTGLGTANLNIKTSNATKVRVDFRYSNGKEGFSEAYPPDDKVETTSMVPIPLEAFSSDTVTLTVFQGQKTVQQTL